MEQADDDLVRIERQRLDLEMRRAEAEEEERLRRREAEERVKQVRGFLVDTIEMFEEIKRQHPPA